MHWTAIILDFEGAIIAAFAAFRLFVEVLARVRSAPKKGHDMTPTEPTEPTEPEPEEEPVPAESTDEPGHDHLDDDEDAS
jgi:hypothetical protein